MPCFSQAKWSLSLNTPSWKCLDWGKYTAHVPFLTADWCSTEGQVPAVHNPGKLETMKSLTLFFFFFYLKKKEFCQMRSPQTPAVKIKLRNYKLRLHSSSLSFHTILPCFCTVLKYKYYFDALKWTQYNHIERRSSFPARTGTPLASSHALFQPPLWNVITLMWLCLLYPPALSYPHLRGEAW